MYVVFPSKKAQIILGRSYIRQIILKKMNISIKIPSRLIYRKHVSKSIGLQHRDIQLNNSTDTERWLAGSSYMSITTWSQPFNHTWNDGYTRITRWSGTMWTKFVYTLPIGPVHHYIPSSWLDDRVGSLSCTQQQDMGTTNSETVHL